MHLFGSRGEYNGRQRIHIANNKDRIQRILQIVSLAVSVLTIACIFCYHGLYISSFAKNLIRFVVHGSLFFYVAKYFILLFYSLHRSEYLKKSWVEFIIILFLIFQFISVNIFHFSIVNYDNFENFYLIFIQFYFLIMVLVELAKMSSTLGKYHLSPPILMVGSFLFLISIGTILLMMPRMTVGGISFIDALFTATSASCITGLSVVSTSACFTIKGQFVILMLIQLGGMSILSFATFFSTFLSRSMVGLRYQYMIRDMMSSDRLSDSVSLLRSIVLTTFIIELAGAALLFTYWKSTGFFISDRQNLFFSLFYTVSAFNNGGFVLIDDSLLNLGVAGSYFPQVVIMALVFLGGIGFVTIRDFFSYRYIRERNKFNWKSLMPQTKIVLWVTFLIIGVCSVMFFMMEYNGVLKDVDGLGNKIFTSVFQITTCRTSGFNVLDVNAMKLSTIIMILVAIFIGGSPSSTGGGIKTTTFFIVVKSVFATIKGKKNIEFDHKAISPTLVEKATTILMMSATFILVSCFMLTVVQPDVSLLEALFETSSAFTTCGLSTGACAEWNWMAKLILVVNMYCGRIGTLTMAFALTRHKKESPHQYPDLYIMLG
ncbi:MAG: potassium transporter TrkG [Bacteroidales bacterium]|nr:potassium transporter TrkG [Bacteroidales bacterium]MDY6348570.1 potassium transporter TrkG [Bacteroidales bacterium]